MGSEKQNANKPPRRINKRWVVTKLGEREMSLRNFEEKMGWSHGKGSRVLQGEYGLRPHETAKMAELLRTPHDELLQAIGVDVPMGGDDKVTVHGWADQHGDVFMTRPDGPRRVPAPPGMAGEDGRALRVRSPGRPADGWLAYYRAVATPEVDSLGRLCLVELATGAWRLATLHRGYSPGTWNLSAFIFGGADLENVGITAAHPILWLKA
jgi:hypothetical protein